MSSETGILVTALRLIRGGSRVSATVVDAPIRREARVSAQRGTPGAVVRSIRPRQWIKNGLVVMAAGAAGALGRDDVPLRVGLTAVAFCLLSSGVYAINDVRDAEEDRLHPRKRYRPVAAGELSAPRAVALGVTLMSVGVGLCWLVRPLVAAVGAGYLLLSLTYTFVWRHFLIVDLIAIAGGFVLRTVAGGVAAPVPLSRWFLLVVTAASICLAAGKRHAELRRTDANGARRRPVLESYSGWLLLVIVYGTAAVALVSYCMWAFRLGAVNGVPWRPITIVPFALCLMRYGAIVRAGGGEAPEELLLRDRRLQLGGMVWGILFALSVAASS